MNPVIIPRFGSELAKSSNFPIKTQFIASIREICVSFPVSAAIHKNCARARFGLVWSGLPLQGARSFGGFPWAVAAATCDRPRLIWRCAFSADIFHPHCPPFATLAPIARNPLPRQCRQVIAGRATTATTAATLVHTARNTNPQNPQ